jgi:ADP-ribose pyrophosphatase YjhB (NUDIX family)
MRASWSLTEKSMQLYGSDIIVYIARIGQNSCRLPIMINFLQRFTRVIWRTLPRKARVFSVRATQTTFTVSATAIITNAERKVLLLDHVLRPNSGWALPGGFLGGNELAHEALRREIAEEIGLVATEMEVLYVNTYRRHVEIFFRVAAAGEPKVGSREIIGYRWFTPEDLPPNMSCVQRQMIERVFSEEFDYHGPGD